MRILLMVFGLLASLSSQAGLPFATAKVEYREVDQTYAVEALIEATKLATVAAQIYGRVAELKFDAGDYVQKGQVIARIDEREASQALAGSQAQVAQAQAGRRKARATFERTKQLFE